ncbi:hypothetical protein MTO96_003672 [Rhipicephalus appendiculatus]
MFNSSADEPGVPGVGNLQASLTAAKTRNGTRDTSRFLHATTIRAAARTREFRASLRIMCAAQQRYEQSRGDTVPADLLVLNSGSLNSSEEDIFAPYEQLLMLVRRPPKGVDNVHRGAAHTTHAFRTAAAQRTLRERAARAVIERASPECGNPTPSRRRGDVSASRRRLPAAKRK